MGCHLPRSFSFLVVGPVIEGSSSVEQKLTRFRRVGSVGFFASLVSVYVDTGRVNSSLSLSLS